MRVAFDTSDLCTAHADGTTRYTRELATRLPEVGKEHEWNFLAPCQQDTKYPTSLKLRGTGKISHFVPHTAGLRRGRQDTNFKWYASPWPKYWTQTRLPFELFRLKPDVLFMPIQQLPVIRPRRMKTIAVVHDLAVHIYPQQFTYKDWLLLHIFSAQVSREADQIIAVSQATADDIAKYYGREENVHVIHHGIDHKTFRAPQSDEKEETLKLLLRKFPSIKKPYILFVGQIQPRKNLVRLIDAFEKVKKDFTDLQLAIAGGSGWLQQPIIQRVKMSHYHDSIHLLGHVPDILLTPLYWHAEVFTLVSLYEGFGMPILEAMACGCPVVTSNVSSMLEVSSDAAVLVDPTNIQSIADGIRKAMGDRVTLSNKGIDRARDFTWEKTAQQTLEVLIDR